MRLQPVSQPAPGTASVFEQSGDDTRFFVGTHSDISYDCGQCSSSLMAGIVPGSVRGYILKCPACGTYNLSEPAKSAQRGKSRSSKKKRRR